MIKYGDEKSRPIEDLISLQRTLHGYFSIIKDVSRYPIGGNEDWPQRCAVRMPTSKPSSQATTLPSTVKVALLTDGARQSSSTP